MRARRIVALARYAAANNLRTPYTWVGGLLLLAMALLGLWSSARSGDGWGLDPSMTVDGALLAAMFGIRSGLIAQRTGGFQTYVRMNFASPMEHMAGAIGALLVSWLLVCAGLFVLCLVLPGGGLAEAAWEASAFAARTGLLLPFVIMAESVTTIEIPFFLPALLYFAILVVLTLTIGEVEAITAFAPPVHPLDYGTLTPHVVRLAISWTAGFGAILGTVWIRARPAGGPARP